MNIVSYILKSILSDTSKEVENRLNEHFLTVAEDVFDYADWKCLERSTTLTLTTGVTEYEFPGLSDDLSKILAVFYGADMIPLNDEYDEIGFYTKIFKRVTDSDPAYFVPLSRLKANTWRGIIYPCSLTTLETATYYYKKNFKLGDTELFDNQMVFVFGILGLYYSGKEHFADSDKADSLSRKYLSLYESRLVSLKQRDKKTVYPKAKFDISEGRRQEILTLRRLQDRRNR